MTGSKGEGGNMVRCQTCGQCCSVADLFRTFVRVVPTDQLNASVWFLSKHLHTENKTARWRYYNSAFCSHHVTATTKKTAILHNLQYQHRHKIYCCFIFILADDTMPSVSILSLIDHTEFIHNKEGKEHPSTVQNVLARQVVYMLSQTADLANWQ